MKMKVEHICNIYKAKISTSSMVLNGTVFHTHFKCGLLTTRNLDTC